MRIYKLTIKSGRLYTLLRKDHIYGASISFPPYFLYFSFTLFSLQQQLLKDRWSGFVLLRGEDEGDNEPVQTQDLGENQDEDHAHEKPGLLGRSPHAGVAHDADGKAGRQAAQAHAQPGAQVEETPAHKNNGQKQSLK